MSGSLNFNTNLGNDLSAAGTDFGTLIQGVGNAVAATQLQLAKTSADSASALAGTLVDVIAVQETVYDDNGTPTSSQTLTHKLPLIDFIDPAFYQWTTVRLQGQFFITELASAAEAKTFTGDTTSNNDQAGLFLIFGGGQSIGGGSTKSTDTQTSSDSATAVGRARMYAQLNPRSDTGVPKPQHAIQGPSIQIVQGEIKDLPGGGITPLTGRTCSLLLQLRRFDGTVITGKSISVDTDGVPWSFTAASTTGADGNVAIQLQRTFLPVPAGASPGTVQDTSPVAVVVTARLGIVSNSITVTF